jgi:hypothetical protein
MPPGDTKEIIAVVHSQTRSVQSHLRSRLDSVQETTTVAMDEADEGIDPTVFNAERSCRTINSRTPSSILITLKISHRPICFMINLSIP